MRTSTTVVVLSAAHNQYGEPLLWAASPGGSGFFKVFPKPEDEESIGLVRGVAANASRHPVLTLKNVNALPEGLQIDSLTEVLHETT